MGQNIRARLPRYVQAYNDRHGRPRYYFRRKGFAKVALPGLPFSTEFMDALAAAQCGVRVQPGSASVKAGSIRALAVSYYVSGDYLALKSNTAGVYKNLIDRFCRELDKDGNPYGDKSAVTLKRNHIESMMDARAAKPDSANGLRRVLRALMKRAVAIGLRPDDPTQGIKKIKAKSATGFHRWSESEIEQFEKRWPIGTKPRLAQALGLYTGQARQDVVAMGPQHIRKGVLEWTRMKTESTTAIELAIPIHPELQKIIDATPSGHLNFLVTEFGKPFGAAGFGNWFREKCDMAGLPNCTFHGLRKAAAVRLAEAGCSEHEIAAITGHASIKEVQRYTKGASRRRLAFSAMEKVKAGTGSV